MASRILPILGALCFTFLFPRAAFPVVNNRAYLTSFRDHIKRVHSDRYGCSNCKERYQCRDKYLAEQERKHKDECKYAKKGRVEVSDFKPEWMTPGEDKRYFKLDFRRMVGLKVEDQYLKICEAIWPRFDSEGLNIC